MPTTASPDSIRAMTLDLFFSYLAVRLNGERAANKRITLNFIFTDTQEKVALRLSNGGAEPQPRPHRR